MVQTLTLRRILVRLLCAGGTFLGGVFLSPYFVTVPSRWLMYLNVIFALGMAGVMFLGAGEVSVATALGAYLLADYLGMSFLQLMIVYLASHVCGILALLSGIIIDEATRKSENINNMTQ